MEILFEKIEKIINLEISKINKKIKGTFFLEQLKYNLLDSLSQIFQDNNFNNIKSNKFKTFYENETQKIEIDIISYDKSISFLNHFIDKNLLLICLEGNVDIKLIGSQNMEIKLIKKHGITLSKGEKINQIISKKSTIMSIYSEDKNLNIEN